MAERPDQLAFEIGVADLDALEVPPEDRLFVPVTEAGQRGVAGRERQVAGDRMCAAEDDDIRPRELEPPGERLERDAVAFALDEDQVGPAQMLQVSPEPTSAWRSAPPLAPASCARISSS